MDNLKQKGFTLLEILVALFVFTILSTLMTLAFRTVLDNTNALSQRTKQFSRLQFALLILSRDLEQAIARPILNSFGKEEPAFVGTHDSFTFTHFGKIKSAFNNVKNNMERTQYRITAHELIRSSWLTLDFAPTSLPRDKILLKINDGHFEYLSEDNKFYAIWPQPTQESIVLPLAVRIYINISPWGTLSQLYVLPTQPIKKKG